MRLFARHLFVVAMFLRHTPVDGAMHRPDVWTLIEIQMRDGLKIAKGTAFFGLESAVKRCVTSANAIVAGKWKREADRMATKIKI